MEFADPCAKYESKQKFSATPKPIVFFVEVTVDYNRSIGRWGITAAGNIRMGSETFSSVRNATVAEEDLIAMRFRPVIAQIDHRSAMRVSATGL